MDNKLLPYNNGRQRRGRNAPPVAVITVPTMLAPTYCIPIEFSVTSTSTVNLPSAVIVQPFRTSSFRCTAVSSGTGSVTFHFLSASVSGASQVVSRSSRQIPIGTTPTELTMRNDRRVQHGIVLGVLVPGVLEIAITGTVNVTGVVYVSFMQPF